MQRTNILGKNRFDGLLILLVFFIFTLSFLFLYLQNIDAEIKSYYEYKKSVGKLHSYNQELDNTFIRAYRYLDNDKVTQDTRMFEKELISLQKNKLTKQFGWGVINRLNDIVKKYDDKLEYIESFKTLNARITSSVYYLYELSKQIKDNGNTTVEVELLLSDILFKIGQVFLDSDLNYLAIGKDLNKVAIYRYMDEDIDYFHQHTEQFLRDVHLLENILKKNKLLGLDESIKDMNTLLEKQYLSNQKEEEFIGFLFFIFAFIILIILINTYMNILKNRKKILHLAYHDTLTSLPNRAQFERYMDALIADKKDILDPFIILFIDLDRFKVINDTLGHDIGDEMLIILSQRIYKILGSENLLARIGGDEFVSIIEVQEDVEIINLLVKQIASVIRHPIRIREYTLNTTASIGIARFPEDGRDKHSLLKHADSAMYHAKDNGRDTYAFYDKSLSVNIQRRLNLEQELVNALKNKEFSLYFQPQYRIETKEITGVEALLRWESKLLGTVSPEEFIAVAEDTGMIVELGYYVFEEACSAYMSWKEQGVDIDLIAINISSVQLRQLDALEKFKAIIDKIGINPIHIEIELTERYIMEYTIDKLTILDDLRGLGCRISIDDFGTGYSSMSYLRSLAIDTIKIDKSFILDLPDNQNDAQVSKAIIVLSQSLGYEVIAEGIETVAQEELLKEYNCDMGQGYYFARPMSSENLVKFYKKHKNETI